MTIVLTKTKIHVRYTKFFLTGILKGMHVAIAERHDSQLSARMKCKDMNDNPLKTRKESANLWRMSGLAHITG